MPVEKSRRILGTQFLKLTTEGEVFIGTLVSREPVIMGENHTFRYVFESDGGKFAMNGTDQVDEALADCPFGLEIEIVYQGTERTLSGFDVKRFRISALEGDNNGETEEQTEG